MKNYWNQKDAIDLCRTLADIAPKHGAHIALTGGCLYKDGPRKDLDIIIYSIRQEAINFERLIFAFANTGVKRVDETKLIDSFVTKLKFGEKCIDLLYPEAARCNPDFYDAPIEKDPFEFVEVKPSV